MLSVRIIQDRDDDEASDLTDAIYEHKLDGLIAEEDHAFSEMEEDSAMDKRVDIKRELLNKRIDFDQELAMLEEKEAGMFSELDGLIDTINTTKRAVSKGAVEVGIWCDKNFVEFMATKDKKTLKDVTDLMIIKWNIVRVIYANKKLVGSDFSVQLKYVEIWEKNPKYYEPVQNNFKLAPHLKAFCQNHRFSHNLDHFALYTYGVGGAMMGLAYIDGVCRAKYKCSVLKFNPKRMLYARVEMHELGHNLGFEHHNEEIVDCGEKQSFMASGERTYFFAPCHKLLLKKALAKKACLKRSNAPKLKILNNDKNFKAPHNLSGEGRGK